MSNFSAGAKRSASIRQLAISDVGATTRLGLSSRPSSFSASNVRERLHRLAEAHVVGKHAAEPRLAEETHPGIPLALIRPERRGEAFWSGVFGRRPRRSQPLPQNAQRLAARPGDSGAGDQLFQSSEFSGARTAEAELFPIHCEVRPEQLVQRGEDWF